MPETSPLRFPESDGRTVLLAAADAAWRDAARDAFAPLRVSALCTPDAAPEARALRATCRWLLVPPGRSVRPPVACGTNAPPARASNEVTVTARRHAESAEEEPHAESAEGAEFDSHAENAESAEPKPHAEGEEN